MNYDPYTVALLNVAEWWTGCNELCPYMGALVQRGALGTGCNDGHWRIAMNMVEWEGV